jgi:hypothetical protein
MNVAEVKNDLIMQILQTNDPLLLEHLAEYFRSLLTHKDWWSELTDTQIELVRRGAEQIDRGEVVPDSAVRAKARLLLQKAS